MHTPSHCHIRTSNTWKDMDQNPKMYCSKICTETWSYIELQCNGLVDVINLLSTPGLFTIEQQLYRGTDHIQNIFLYKNPNSTLIIKHTEKHSHSHSCNKMLVRHLEYSVFTQKCNPSYNYGQTIYLEKSPNYYIFITILNTSFLRNVCTLIKIRMPCLLLLSTNADQS